MKLKFKFMKKHKTTVYQVDCSVFMAGTSVLFESTNRQEAMKKYLYYTHMDGDPYEVITMNECETTTYLNFKRL